MVQQDWGRPCSTSCVMRCLRRWPRAPSAEWQRRRSCTSTLWTIATTSADTPEPCPAPWTGGQGQRSLVHPILPPSIKYVIIYMYIASFAGYIIVHVPPPPLVISFNSRVFVRVQGQRSNNKNTQCEYTQGESLGMSTFMYNCF